MSYRSKPAPYVQVPHEFMVEKLIGHKRSGILVILVVIRKTLGWHKDRDVLSLSQLQRLTGLSRHAVLDGIADAGDLIIRTAVGKSYSYELNIDVSEYKDMLDKPTEEQSDTQVPAVPTEQPKRKPEKRRKEPDPRFNSPQVQAYIGVVLPNTKRYPNAVNYDRIIQKIGKKSAAEIAPFYEEWTARGYSPFGLGWLDWVANGSVPRTPAGSGGRQQIAQPRTDLGHEPIDISNEELPL